MITRTAPNSNDLWWQAVSLCILRAEIRSRHGVPPSSYENRTSLPGSISKSSASESSVFGLITSSTNFT